jgi:hypothetical protein
MEGLEAKDVISLLFQLFPGFVAAWILYGFTSYSKPSYFERLVEALVFSFLIKILLIPESAVFYWVGRNFGTLGFWDDDSALLTSTISGIIIGLLGAYLANNDGLYLIARTLKLTTRNAYPSVWHAALAGKHRYMVLHLKDRRRIYGWPIQWPAEATSGHFELVDSCWLPEQGDGGHASADSIAKALSTRSGVDSILIPARSVQFLEILNPTEDEKNDHHSNRPRKTVPDAPTTANPISGQHKS